MVLSALRCEKGASLRPHVGERSLRFKGGLVAPLTKLELTSLDDIKEIPIGVGKRDKVPTYPFGFHHRCAHPQKSLDLTSPIARIEIQVDTAFRAGDFVPFLGLLDRDVWPAFVRITEEGLILDRLPWDVAKRFAPELHRALESGGFRLDDDAAHPEFSRIVHGIATGHDLD